MNQSTSGPGGSSSARRQFGFIFVCLLVLLGFFFRDGLPYGRTVFANDGPLGLISAKWSNCGAQAFLGCWQDLNWLGGVYPSASPTITVGLSLAAGALLWSKTYAPFVLLFLGLSAWICFRQWKFSPLACVLGGLAATLNSAFFSAACWGVGSQELSYGLDFLALAALADQTSPRRWLRVILAGFAIGMSVMEAFDIGAIFSLVIAAYVLFQALAGEGTASERLARSAGRLALVAAFAAFIATSSVSTLVGTQIKGIAGAQQDQKTKWEHWDWATQWSFPKREMLSLFVPGLFGFRMDTPQGLPAALQERYQGGSYWGAAGRDPAWDRYFASGKEGPPPAGFIRYGGGGAYAGVLVVLLALWTVLQAFRKEHSVFSLAERKFIWFWSGVALISVLLCFGRFAPFYQLFYALPYASTIRNPAKFIAVVEWILVILFAYGVNGLSRKCLDAPGAVLRDLPSQLRAWWAKTSTFDKIWVRGSAVALATSLLAWMIYSASRERLAAYLQEVRFDSGMAAEIAGFSIRQAGLFVLLLTITLGLMALVLSGYFGGRRARLGGVLLGLLLVADLGWSNFPWVITYDYQQKYQSNPVVEMLRQQSYEHRVAILPFRAPEQLALLDQMYRIEWAQHHFMYYNIQSLDVVQMPRAPVDYIAFESALAFDNTTNTLNRVTRRWELTNTRYLLGAAGFQGLLNQQIDPIQRRFQVATRFDIIPRPGVQNPTSLAELTAVIKPNGQYAVFEFAGALPRAKLYADWQVSTNDSVTLTNLANAEFNPVQTVLVAEPLPAPGPGSVTNQNVGTVEFADYAPKRIALQAQVGCPAVLLLNDRFDPNWKVTVDGKPDKLLRCNYIMRGVYLPPGKHTVEFRFEPPIGALYVSLVAVALGLGLCGLLALYPGKQQVDSSPG